MIYRNPDNTYCISSHYVWMPGCYATERAARYAFRFTDEHLQVLQESKNPGGVIAYEDLQRLRKSIKK